MKACLVALVALCMVASVSAAFGDMKLCVKYWYTNDNQYRAHMVVPSTWTAATCGEFCSGSGGGCDWNEQGCLLANSTFVYSVRGIPNPNCDWTLTGPAVTPSEKALTAAGMAGEAWPTCGVVSSQGIQSYNTRAGSQWTPDVCTYFANAVQTVDAGDTGVLFQGQQICVFAYIKGGFSVNTTGGVPSPNCGWQSKPTANVPMEVAIKSEIPEQRVCIALGKKGRTSSLAVPMTHQMTIQDCVNYVSAAGGTNLALGCIFPSGFSVGARGGGPPSPNCW